MRLILCSDTNWDKENQLFLVVDYKKMQYAVLSRKQILSLLSMGRKVEGASISSFMLNNILHIDESIPRVSFNRSQIALKVFEEYSILIVVDVGAWYISNKGRVLKLFSYPKNRKCTKLAEVDWESPVDADSYDLMIAITLTDSSRLQNKMVFCIDTIETKLVKKYESDFRRGRVTAVRSRNGITFMY